MPLKSDMPPVAVAKEHFGHRLLSAFWQHSLANPHRAALVNAENEADRVTHRELYVYSHSVAAFLEERHFGHGNIACLVLPNCWEFVPIFVGVSLRGGAISGASYLFTDYELQQQFLDSKTEVVFCADSTLDRVLKAAKNAPRIKTIVVVEDAKSPNKEYPFGTTSFRQVLEKQPTTAGTEPNVNVVRDLLLLPYSSGTTGSPKGVMISHTNFGTMMNMVDQHFSGMVLPKIDAGFDWTKEFAQLMLPFYHIYGVGLLCYMLLNGTTGLILKQFNPDIYCKTIEKYKIRIQMLVPPILVFLAKHPIVSKYDLSSLTFILCGAAPAGADLCEEVKKRLPSVKYIAQGYGMTEVSMASHFPVLDKPRYAAAGKLVSNLEMKIIDPESGKETPKGERGEICIRGPTVMLGYFNRPQATAETIDKEGWLRTGDIGYVDEEGFLYIVDRIKELIKVKGFQVPPAELEDLLLSHPDVRDCAVIGVPDPRTGEVPKAFIVKANDRLTERDVADFVKQRVSSYKQLQGGVEFVAEIPKSAAGKILRRILRDRAGASKPAQCKI